MMLWRQVRCSWTRIQSVIRYLNYLNLKTSFEQSWLQQQTYFEALLAELGLEPDIRKVSRRECAAGSPAIFIL